MLLMNLDFTESIKIIPDVIFLTLLEFLNRLAIQLDYEHDYLLQGWTATNRYKRKIAIDRRDKCGLYMRTHVNMH